MAKNEIHARIAPELMETLKRICSDRSCNLSDVTRAALVLYVVLYDSPVLEEHHKLSKSESGLGINLIERQSLKTIPATPNLLDELTSDDVIDW